ncbi:MAG: type II toxin-antitoxin system ParD family antitoxin [Novosphingobium sp.]
MTNLVITVPDDLQQWVESRIALGYYVDESDYLRDLLRRDQEQDDDEMEWLRGLIAEGLASGISEERPETIIDTVIARRASRRGRD